MARSVGSNITKCDGHGRRIVPKCSRKNCSGLSKNWSSSSLYCSTSSKFPLAKCNGGSQVSIHMLFMRSGLWKEECQGTE